MTAYLMCETKKTCSTCGEAKPLPDFRRDQRYKGGRGGQCNVCRAAYARRWREKNPEKGRAAVRKWAKQNPERKRALEQRYREERPAADRARHAVNNALRAGKLVKPSECSSCGITGKLHGHHEDYSKPLEVRWLCPRCHSEVHRT